MQIHFLCSYTKGVNISGGHLCTVCIYIHTHTHILMMSVHLCNAVVITPIRTYKLHPHC